jgi:hypothetical protein
LAKRGKRERKIFQLNMRVARRKRDNGEEGEMKRF